MMPQLNDFLNQSGMSLPDSLIKRKEEDEIVQELNEAPETKEE